MSFKKLLRGGGLRFTVILGLTLCLITGAIAVFVGGGSWLGCWGSKRRALSG